MADNNTRNKDNSVEQNEKKERNEDISAQRDPKKNDPPKNK
ncbi:3-methyladenine DNA glycosylase [Bacillus sp. V5-8f]|nr:3-methyladenine DNA glycosylase [Bacillus sp. V5-8f]PLT34430.1 3-methyladenine DNA glycosylase [Bacillus sp. V5-8f]